jgi:hypothetical protein
MVRFVSVQYASTASSRSAFRGDAQVEVGRRHPQRVHDAHGDRAAAGGVGQLRRAVRGEYRQFTLQREVQAQQAVALALEAGQRDARAVLGELDRAARLRRRRVGHAAVDADRAHGALAGGLELHVLARAQHRVVRLVVVVAVRQRHEVVGLVVDQRVVALSKSVRRHPEAVLNARVRAVRHQRRDGERQGRIVVVVDDLSNPVCHVALVDETGFVDVAEFCRTHRLVYELVNQVTLEAVAALGFGQHRPVWQLGRNRRVDCSVRFVEVV